MELYILLFRLANGQCSELSLILMEMVTQGSSKDCGDEYFRNGYPPPDTISQTQHKLNWTTTTIRKHVTRKSGYQSQILLISVRREKADFGSARRPTRDSRSTVRNPIILLRAFLVARRAEGGGDGLSGRSHSRPSSSTKAFALQGAAKGSANNNLAALSAIVAICCSRGCGRSARPMSPNRGMALESGGCAP